MKDLLRENNLKVTKGRLSVLDVFKRADYPLSAEEVYNSISDASCKSLTTAYRIINQLESSGIIRKTLQLDGISYYELSVSSHKHYIICTQCGKVSPIEHCPIKPFEDEVENKTGYIVTGHLIELNGICPECRKKGD